MSVTNGAALSTRNSLITYGTETGNAQDIAYEVDQCLRRLHFSTVSRELNSLTLQDVKKWDLVVFVVSTTGQGDFPSNAHKFWLSLLRKKLPVTLFDTVRYALVGLCDSSYPKFNLAGRKLHKRLQQLGARPLLQSCEADEQGEEGTEGAFSAWLPLFQDKVLAHFPLEHDQGPIPPDQKLPISWQLKVVHSVTDHDTQSIQNGTELRNGDVVDHGDMKTFPVILEENERVTPSPYWQDVRFLRMRSRFPINYLPGDALAIRPKNLPEDVDQLIALQGWHDVADINMVLQNNSEIGDDGVFDSSLSAKGIFTLRQLLTEHLDIKAIPRRSFFHKISHFTKDEMQKERALEFTDPQYLDEYFDYATRPRRSILEVLQEFDTVKIPWQEAVDVFPLIRPRQFSIASGGKLKQDGYVFELLVAIVKYRTVIKRIREGLCTKYLSLLPVGTQIDVALHTEGRFHKVQSAFERPYLLIGGGTGVAPLRSVIHEKYAVFPRSTESILMFGCRSSGSDYFFRSEWDKMDCQDNPFLRVITAFSRDQGRKVYVQDRIRENADMLKRLLEDPQSVILVCGSSGAMPKAVRQALLEVIATSTDSNEAGESAEEVLVQIEKEGRYKQETW